MSRDTGALLRAFAAANVQFVVVGDPPESDPPESDPLVLVVSRHPTNLETASKVLDRLGASLQTAAPVAVTKADEPESGPRRIGDPLGTVVVTTSAGAVQLMFGGPRRSLYAETLAASEPRELAGVAVQWAPAPATLGPAPRVTSRMVGKRLLSLAEGLAHLIDRHDEPVPDGPQE